MNYRTLLLKIRFKEILQYDFRLLHSILVFSITPLVYFFSLFRFHNLAIKFMSLLHNRNWKYGEKIAKSMFSKYLLEPKLKDELNSLIESYVDNVKPLLTTKKFFENPEKFFPHICIVLKRSKNNEKGVLLLNYSYYFPLFMKLFNFREIMNKYYIVLEPSWSGYFQLDILSYINSNHPVFVQSPEPKDFDFINNLKSNLVPVPIGANWWVDSRIFRKLENVEKDIDVIIISAWAPYKRHYSMFEAIRRLKEKGVLLKIAMIGYPLEWDINIIKDMAKYFNIYDQIEFHESISQEEVNYHLNRSKINLLWSRFEGINRSSLEGMYSGVPCILREGFNYGYSYPYINSYTGMFSSENDLSETILHMLNDSEKYTPHLWISERVSVSNAIKVLEDHIRAHAEQNGEEWTEGLVAKVNGLHGIYYWDDNEFERFSEDYNYLKSMINV